MDGVSRGVEYNNKIRHTSRCQINTDQEYKSETEGGKGPDRQAGPSF